MRGGNWSQYCPCPSVMGARRPIGAHNPPRFHCRTIKRRSGYPFGKPVAGRITRPLPTRDTYLGNRVATAEARTFRNPGFQAQSISCGVR
jgi:hypothetical protein